MESVLEAELALLFPCPKSSEREEQDTVESVLEAELALLFPCPKSSEREEQDTVESVLEAELALLACDFPPQRMVVPQRPTIAGPQWKPTGFFATGTVTAVVQLRGGDELKRSGQLLDEAVGVIEDAGGAAGAVPKPFFNQFSSKMWARSAGSGGGATGGAVGAKDGAARVGGGGAGAAIAGSDGWTRPGTAVVVGAGGRHGPEMGAQA